MSKLVRLQPKNKKAGFFMDVYTVQRKKFIAGKWYQVDDDLADYLSGVHSRPSEPHAPDSKLCFTICDTRTDAREFVREEKKRALKLASSRRPRDLTTKDLAEGTHREIDLMEDVPEDMLEDVEAETREEKQARKARALRRGDKKQDAEKKKAAAEKKTAKAPKKKRETAAQKKKREAAERKAAQKELDAANDHEGTGAEEPPTVDFDEDEFE